VPGNVTFSTPGHVRNVAYPNRLCWQFRS
jgi:hypothetical protein